MSMDRVEGLFFHQIPQMNWSLFPIQAAVCQAEILHNLGPDINDIYSHNRAQTLKPPYDKANLITINGRSGSGKDGVDQEWQAVEEEDPIYQEWEYRNGLHLKRLRVKFASAALAAQISGRISPTFNNDTGRWEIKHRAYLHEEYAEIGKLMGEVVEYGLDKVEGPREIRVLPSALTCGVIDGRLEMINDRGDKIAHKLATSNETRKLLHQIYLLRDIRTPKEVLSFRAALTQATAENVVQICLESGFRIHVKTSEGLKRLEDLTLAERERLAQILPKMMAPSKSVERSDAEQDEMIQRLDAISKFRISARRLPVCYNPFERAYYQRLQRGYKLPGCRSRIFFNEWFGGDKSYYISLEGYGPDDLVAQLYPELKELNAAVVV